ncbi:DUF2848 domain-containing protein [Paraburkholderia silviterrae]|uniref:DUF2848 domain-containing protein n=1 Tax=Paraburkholderia silviterrae TaxID=2528715 RepID=A0A4R5LZB6_9BURK|nr:DUF2848 domain-containing protein [Paraburkholderia silviterrae]TDG17746.1 DUF2848 domain-containing protein [Paraburkholderia silviterrae]
MTRFLCAIDGDPTIELAPRRLIIAGWAGRNRDEIEHHIAELVALGVKRPSSVPCFYEVSASLLTSDPHIDVIGTHSSGEVEAVLMHDATHGLLVGIGSDHTDRRVESYDVAVSKQVCAKPLGTTLWRFDEVAAHWDALVARSWRIDAAGERVRYQEGPLARLLPPQRLIGEAFGHAGLPVGTALFCGTQPVIGALCPSAAFEIELHDPVLGRSLRHRYAVASLVHVE